MNPKRKNKRKTPQYVGDFLNNHNIFYAMGKITSGTGSHSNEYGTTLKNGKYSYLIPLYTESDGSKRCFNANPILFPFPGVYCPLSDELTKFEQTTSLENLPPELYLTDEQINNAWNEYTKQAETLQSQYLMHSGDKEINPSLKWVGGVEQKTTGTLEISDETELAQILLDRFWERWCHLAYINNFTISYNPIWNTDRNQNSSDRGQDNNTGSITDDGTTTTTYDSKVLHTLNQSETTDNTGTQKTDTSDSNTQTLNTNKANTGTQTRTDDLTNATTVDGTSTRTDNLHQYSSHDGTETRTDNLSQNTTDTKSNTQTLNTQDLTTNDLKTSETDNTTNKETRDLTQGHTGTDATQYNTTDKTIETSSNTEISTDSGSDSSNKTTTNDTTEKAAKTGTNTDTTTYDTKEGKGTSYNDTETTTYGKTSTETQTGTVSKAGNDNTERTFNRKYTDDTTRSYDSYKEDTSGYDNHTIDYGNGEKEETTIYPKTTYTNTDTETVETPNGQDKTVETQENGKYAFNSSDLSNVSKVKDTTEVGEVGVDGRKITTTVKGQEGTNYVKEQYENNTPQTVTKTGGHTDNAEQASGKTITGSYSDNRTYEDDATKNTEKEDVAHTDKTTNDLTNTTTDGGTDTVGKLGTTDENSTKTGTEATAHELGETTTTTNTGTVTDATTNTYGKINNTTNNGNKSDTTTKTGTDTETKNLTDTESGTVNTTTDTTKNGTSTGTVTVAKTGTIADDGKEEQTVTNTGTQTNANNWTENTANTGTQTNKEDSTNTEKQTGTQTNENNLNEATTGTVKDDRTIGQTRTDNLKQVASLTGENSDGKTGTDSVVNKNTRRNDLMTTTENRHSEYAYGNIGVTMTQQMLQAEVDFWTNYDYLDYVFQDIDKILAVQVY